MTVNLRTGALPNETWDQLVDRLRQGDEYFIVRKSDCFGCGVKVIMNSKQDFSLLCPNCRQSAQDHQASLYVPAWEIAKNYSIWENLKIISYFSGDINGYREYCARDQCRQEVQRAYEGGSGEMPQP